MIESSTVTTTTEKEIRQVMRLTEKMIGVEAPATAGRAKTTGVLKNKIFQLLTNTLSDTRRNRSIYGAAPDKSTVF